MQNLQSFLDSKFKKNQKEKLGNVIDHIKRSDIIPKGTLVIMASANAQLRLKMLDEDIPNKGFSTPLAINEQGKELGITPNYLMWYFSQETVKNYLIQYATGATFLRIPRDILFDIQVPLPIYPNSPKFSEKEIILQDNTAYKLLINQFYQDYLLNLRNESFKVCIILAGAICEVILYQVLLDVLSEQGGSEKIIKDDPSIALGKMITYAKLLRLDSEDNLNIPLNHFEDIQQKRNKAIHVRLSGQDIPNFKKEDLACFDQIIKFFGI
jgi:hypothetical protein